MAEEKCFGLIYIDPNGVVDTNWLEKITKEKAISRLDILFNYNASAKKRSRCAFNLNYLLDEFKKINKENWYVSKPNGKWQWSLFFGSNSDCFKLPKKYGFHNILSDEGKYILHKLNFTKKEYKRNLPNQPKLEDFRS